jgi:NTE family protein
MATHEADGVFQGGGVKGLALVGALLEFGDETSHPDTYVDTWKQLAGTSAGAIIAAYLACGHSVQETKELIENADFESFQDWGPGGEVIGGGLNLLRVHGLCHGKVFLEWFQKATKGKTFGQIKAEGRTLKVIAADITRHEMLDLPDALTRYRLAGSNQPIDPDQFAIADAVRMSMSIPYFFTPIELVHHETGTPSTIVDGGVLSNFPVWIFDVKDRDAVRPTFGFRLTGGRGVGGGLEGVIHTLGWAAEMGANIFHTATDAWDTYFLSTATLVRTCTVKIGDIGTTDFDLDDAKKKSLLDAGHAAANEFLNAYQPENYVNRHGQKLAAAATVK